ncbi:MAG: 1-phosphofructokinase [Bacteroidota bacterium]
MIVTLTANPALDYTAYVPQLELGEVNRFRNPLLDPAGKGINASRMIHRLGWPTIAFGFLAGDIGHIAMQALDQEGVPHHFVPVPGQTRINVTIVEDSKRSTSLYGPGPVVDSQHQEILEGMLDFWMQACRVLVLAGSLPTGMPKDSYASFIRRARSLDVCTILDADGEALRLGVEAKPNLIKPNVEEAQRLLGRELPDQAAVLEGARELCRRGIEMVIISMGAQGAVCVRGEQAWKALPPSVERRSTVGSGDSLVAGLAVAIARGQSFLEGLRLGTAAGAATASTAGTSLGTGTDLARLMPRVPIEEL